MPWWSCLNCASKTTRTNCNDIVILDYAHHSLHDVPSDVFQYERTLEELYLSSNRITELPRQLFLCHGLKVLDISDNDLTSIPTALSSLINIRKINLARNSLTRLTDSIIACKSLTYLDLSINSLEKLPDAITGLLGLEELYLNDTFLEFLPSNFGRLTNLRILELRDNNLKTLPKSMNRLTNLKRLDIGNNEFSELPEVIGSLTGLTELWCDGNRIRRFNCNVGNLNELVHFDASNNLIQYLPTEIGSWQKCQEICLSANELEEFPFSIGMMKSLISLKVDENQLQELPDSICEMENLEELMLSHNDLVKLPNTIGLLRRLRFLTADENLLRALPNEICSCSNLTILSVRGNKLSKIPVDIGRLTQLRVLNIVNNFLNNLPVTILNLTQLSALWISDNQSQPLMPLQKEFHKETQCYYLTCYLLPQMYTSNSTPTNAPSISTAPDSTYDYYAPPSTCDNSQPNMHLAAIENLSLAAVSKRKRNICFASDPPQEIAPNLRLMRSPTPYPKELRMMQAKFAANKSAQGHHHNHHDDGTTPPKYMLNENTTTNLDHNQQNMKILNTINTENELNKQTLDTNSSVNHKSSDDTMHSMSMINNFNTIDGHAGSAIAIHSNLNNSIHLNTPNTNMQQQQFILPNQPLPNLEYSSNSSRHLSYQSDSRIQTPIPNVGNQYNGIVQYDSIRRKTPGPIDDTVDFSPNNIRDNLNFQPQQQQQQQQQQQLHQYQQPSYHLPSAAYNETNSNPNENGLKPVTNSNLQPYQSASMEIEINHNTDSPQQQPPPYHIAKAFTKKSKQDLLIYDIYRNNYTPQQQQSQPQPQPQQIQLENSLNETHPHIDHHYTNSSSIHEIRETNLKTSPIASTVDSDNNEINSNDSINHSRNNSLLKTKTPWLFGEHKNPTVIQLSVPKLSNDIGFKITRHYNQGIFISDVEDQSSAYGKLSVRDKILDVDGVDFTKISLVDAETVLSNAGSVINIMISREK